MTWSEIRTAYPDQWLVVEILASDADGQSLVPTRLSVVAQCADGEEAMSAYRELHREYPERELAFVHTRREQLMLETQRWLGVRPASAS